MEDIVIMPWDKTPVPMLRCKGISVSRRATKLHALLLTCSVQDERMRQDPAWVPVIAGLTPAANGAKLQKHTKAHLEVVAEFKTNLARVARSTTWFPLTIIRRLQACLLPLVRLQALQTSYFSTRDIVACVVVLFHMWCHWTVILAR